MDFENSGFLVDFENSGFLVDFENSGFLVDFENSGFLVDFGVFSRKYGTCIYYIFNIFILYVQSFGPMGDTTCKMASTWNVPT